MTPYCVWIASPTIVRRLAGVEFGFGGALVDWLARAVLGDVLVPGSAAEGRAAPAPTGCPCALKLSRATSPRLVPKKARTMRFTGIDLRTRRTRSGCAGVAHRPGAASP